MCSLCCVSTTLLIYRPLRDGWLSWPCLLTDSRRLNSKVVTHPASSLAQDRKSSPAKTSVLTTKLHRQPTFNFSKVDCKAPFVINPVSSAVAKQSNLKLYLNTKLPRCKTVARLQEPHQLTSNQHSDTKWIQHLYVVRYCSSSKSEIIEFTFHTRSE